MVAGEAPSHLGGAVARTVVDQEDPELGQRLGEQAGQGARQKRSLVARRHQGEKAPGRRRLVARHALRQAQLRRPAARGVEGEDDPEGQRQQREELERRQLAASVPAAAPAFSALNSIIRFLPELENNHNALRSERDAV